MVSNSVYDLNQHDDIVLFSPLMVNFLAGIDVEVGMERIGCRESAMSAEFGKSDAPY
jgi:hypothetical protein